MLIFIIASLLALFLIGNLPASGHDAHYHRAYRNLRSSYHYPTRNDDWDEYPNGRYEDWWGRRHPYPHGSPPDPDDGFWRGFSLALVVVVVVLGMVVYFLLTK